MPELGRMTEDRTRVAALAALIQRWAELCKELSKKETTPELQWLTRGMAIAHQMDAWRARALAHPAAVVGPPEEDLGFVAAFKAILNMAGAMAQAQAPSPPHVQLMGAALESALELEPEGPAESPGG